MLKKSFGKHDFSLILHVNMGFSSSIWGQSFNLFAFLFFLLGACSSETEIHKTALNYFKDGNYYYLDRDFQNAIWNYQKAINLDSETSEFHFNLGLSYYEIGNYPESLESYLRALELRPELSDTYFNIALVYNRMEKSREADEYYGRYQSMLSLRKSRELAREKVVAAARKKAQEEEDEMNRALKKAKTKLTKKTNIVSKTNNKKTFPTKNLKKLSGSPKFSSPKRQGLNIIPQWD